MITIKSPLRKFRFRYHVPRNCLLTNKLIRLQAHTTQKLNVADDLLRMAQDRKSDHNSLILQGQAEGLEEAANYIKNLIG